MLTVLEGVLNPFFNVCVKFLMFLCLSFFHVSFHPEVEFLREGSLLDFLFRVKHEMNDSLIMRLDNTSGFLELSLLNITFPD